MSDAIRPIGPVGPIGSWDGDEAESWDELVAVYGEERAREIATARAAAIPETGTSVLDRVLRAEREAGQDGSGPVHGLEGRAPLSGSSHADMRDHVLTLSRRPVAREISEAVMRAHDEQVERLEAAERGPRLVEADLTFNPSLMAFECAVARGDLEDILQALGPKLRVKISF